MQVLRLLKAGVNVNDGSSKAPLMVTACHCTTESIQLLIEHGAQVNTRNASGQTALDIARDRGHERSIQVLIAAGQ